MESSDQAGKITTLILLVAAAGLLGWAVWSYCSAPLLARLAARSDTPLHIVVATAPALQISYNPHTRKAVVTHSAQTCDLAQIQTCFDNTPDGFFVPRQTDPELFRTGAEHFLSHWRYNPLLGAALAKGYFAARRDGRTDIPLAVFITLGMELAQLKTNDFTLTYPAKPKGKNKKTRKPEPVKQISADELLASAPQPAGEPLKLEIYNASGQQGLAQRLKEYLRAQRDKGLLNVDVMKWENYPYGRKDKTEVIDYSSRLIEVNRLSHAINFTGTPRAETAGADIYDVRIILGKDFQMPL